MNLRPQRDLYDMNRTSSSSAAIVSFMNRTYFWMMIALVISGGVAFAVSRNPETVINLVSNKWMFYGLFALQFAAVFILTAFINRMSYMLTASMYLGYAILTGITFSIIFLAYSAADISQAFFVSGFGFLGLSVYGFTTKRDLGPIGKFCITGLFGLIGLSLLALIFPSLRTNAVNMMMCIAGLAIFSGLAAYDTQRLKELGSMIGPEEAKKESIRGALMLYLDFINLFLMVLQLFGRRN